jgi:hypothetical protein
LHHWGSSTCKNYALKKAFKRHMEEFHGKFCDLLVVRGWPPKDGGQKRNPRTAEQDFRHKDSQDGNCPARVWKAKLNKMIWCCNYGLSRWLLQEKYLAPGTDKWAFIKNKVKVAYDEYQKSSAFTKTLQSTLMFTQKYWSTRNPPADHDTQTMKVT